MKPTFTKQTVLLVLSLTVYISGLAQHQLPILRTNTSTLSIKDGNELRTDYWTIDPRLELDIYTADKLNSTKLVTFYSDIDSITFEIKPREYQNFLVIYNEKDTCLTQVKSGLTFNRPANFPLTQDTIPFILTKSNNIIIETILNESDTVNLMFHTAQNSITLTEEAVKKITMKGFDKSEKAISWGGESRARYSEGNELVIKNFKWENLLIWEDKHTGPSADGKFGPSLFEDKVIELNFDKNIMVIHSYLPKLNSDYQKSNLIFKQRHMFIETSYKINDNEYTNHVLIHSGYGGTLLLDDKFTQENNIGSQLKIISESQLKNAHGHILKTKKAILPYFFLGKNSFENMPVNFFEGAIGSQHLSVIGGNILKRFNVFIDLQNAYLYYKPSQLATLPFENS